MNKHVSALTNRLEPGTLWVHVAHPVSGAMKVAGMTCEKALSLKRDLVVCSYDGLIESYLPEGIHHSQIEQARVEKPRYPVFFELDIKDVPSMRFSNRTLLVVDAAHKCEVFCDFDDWKALAKDIRHPIMVTWELPPGEELEDVDPGEADFVTWSFYDEEQLILKRIHEP